MSAAKQAPMSRAVVHPGIDLRPDPGRVIARFFVPGREDVGPGDSRAAPVIERILALPEPDVEAAMLEIDTGFSHRHRDLHALFSDHAAMVMPRIATSVQLSTARRLLLGATFTHEYAIEGAALCNPCAVLHPMQPGSTDARFVVSVRGVGEGHRSSIGFRTGTVSASGTVTIDAPGPHLHTGRASPGRHDRSVFHARLAELGDDHENAAYVLDQLPATFDDTELEERITELTADRATRRRASTTVTNMRRLAQSSYRLDFDDGPSLSERVLWPRSPAEAHGMEDARFVRFQDGSDAATYYGTYTAFDGANVAQHLVETRDFVCFDIAPMGGAAATGKGLALFPRRIGGRYAALSRSDRETNAIAFSDDLRWWPTSQIIQVPERPWEIVQLGNCGSPIETDAGWLVLTHGVGAMRTYSIGAMLLDLDDPTHVIARSARPILTPADHERDGYVPNVVYSCGAIVHGDVLVLPYGVADQSIAFATFSVREILADLVDD